MATADCSNEITKEECFWADMYVGSPEALIAAGLVRAEQLPGQPGRGKVSQSYYDNEPVPAKARPPKDIRYLNVRRLSARRFEVTRPVSEAIQSVRTARLRADRILQTMSKSQAQYRDRSIEVLIRALGAARVRLEDVETEGFRFNAETLEEFDELAVQLVAVLHKGRVVSDAGTRAAAVTQVNVGVAKADVQLQECLAGAMTLACIDQQQDAA